MKTPLLVLALVLVPAVVSAQTPAAPAPHSRWTRVAHWSIFQKSVLGAGDLGESMDLFGMDKNSREANPALAWGMKQPFGVGIAKGAFEGASDYSLIKLSETHPVWASILSWIASGFSIYAMHHNLQLIRDYQAGR